MFCPRKPWVLTNLLQISCSESPIYAIALYVFITVRHCRVCIYILCGYTIFEGCVYSFDKPADVIIDG